jgi:predicted aspartyl protease
MHSSVRLGALCFAVALSACATDPPPETTAADTCTVDHVADVPAHVVGGAIAVAAKINDSPVQMVLDTGATASILDQLMVDALGLPDDPHRQTTVHGVGGEVLSRNALIDSFEIGGQEWQSMSLPTGRLPNNLPADPPVAGVLGADRLSSFDVELDVPHGRMTLWDVRHCSGDFVRWDFPHFAVPLTRRERNRMVAGIGIDGRPVTALIAWGARTSSMTEDAAERLGVTPDILEKDRMETLRGSDRNDIAVRLHRFDAVRIGRQMIHHATIRVGGLHLNDVDMLLGADYARTRHIWLSYATRQMFVAVPKAGGRAAP